MSDSALHWGHREYMGRGYRRILSEHTVHTVHTLHTIHTVHTLKSLTWLAAGNIGKNMGR